MIKRFHVLYVGQIELDNVGLKGTPANERRYSNQRLSEVFATTRKVARLMDDSATTRCGRPSTTSSARATNACPIWCSLGCGSPRRPSA